MTEQVQLGAGGKRYHVGDVTVLALPDEMTFPLRQSEFQILCDGDTSEAKARRDLYTGFCFGALLGLISQLAVTDWKTVWEPAHRWWFIGCTSVLVALVIGPGIVALNERANCRRALTNSACSRLRAGIAKMFADRADLNPEEKG